MCNYRENKVPESAFVMPMIYVKEYDKIFSLTGIIQRSGINIFQIPMSEMPSKIIATSSVFVINQSPFVGSDGKPILEHQIVKLSGVTYSIEFHSPDQWFCVGMDITSTGDAMEPIEVHYWEQPIETEGWNYDLYRFLCQNSEPQTPNLIQFVEDK
jgi:hypothetical protein